MRDVDPDPLALQLLRRMHRRPATAERIEDHVAFVAAGRDDAFKQRDRLLRRIAETLLVLAELIGGMSSHRSLSGSPWQFVEVSLALRHPSCLRRVNPTLLSTRPCSFGQRQCVPLRQVTTYAGRIVRSGPRIARARAG